MHGQVKQTITNFLHNQEDIGEAAGGSGHLSTTSLQITTLDISEPDSRGSYAYKVEVTFVKGTETEFTYYPDNPPLEEQFSQIFYLDEHYTITGFTQKKLVQSNMDIDHFIEPVDDREDTRTT